MKGVKIIKTIVKILGGIYTVLDAGDLLTCSVRSSAKKLKLMVGDKVETIPNEFERSKHIITSCLPRKNSIPRPPVANIDKLLIVIAPSPEPDLLLVDKLIVYCKVFGIEPVIVLNKCDLCKKEFIDDILRQYKFFKVFVISAKNRVGTEDLKQYLIGSLSAVSGQSAVGKSSLINAIFGQLNLETQGLSQKSQRGKHTTRVNELYCFDGIMLADTPGFSSLELNIDYRSLSGYYPEFENVPPCKYQNCSHVKEGKDCAVIKSVADGKINKDRYERFCELYKKLYLVWEKKYD